jgi:hypothetical protein
VYDKLFHMCQMGRNRRSGETQFGRSWESAVPQSDILLR